MKRSGIVRVGIMLLLAALTAGAFASAESLGGTSGIAKPTGDLAVRTPSKPMEMLTTSTVNELNEQMANYAGSAEELLQNQAQSYYYYDNLEPVAKEIYDVMYGVCRDPASQGNIGLMMTAIDPQSSEFYFAFNVAYRALCFDHPELFWLYSGEEAELGYGSEAISQHGFYFVYIMMLEPFENFSAQMNEFNRAAREFLADIDTSRGEYATVRQIHDKLIGLVDYNNDVGDHVQTTVRGQDLAHTAYGALVRDSSGNANSAVCDGYTLAFEYLLQQCGIEVVFLGGMAGSDELSAGGHAWNLVKVDGTWYEVDSTWDDWGNMENDLTPDMEVYDGVMEALSDAQYREKLDHYLFLISTEEMRHFVPGDAYDYINKAQTLVFHLAQESVHIRLEDDLDPMNPDPQVIKLAPIAMANYPRGY